MVMLQCLHHDGAKVSDKRTISLAEVALHDTPDDCWVVLHDTVYDLTPFLYMHPGGMDILMEWAGRDATLAYQEVGHNSLGLSSLSHLALGVLPAHERLMIKSFN